MEKEINICKCLTLDEFGEHAQKCKRNSLEHSNKRHEFTIDGRSVTIKKAEELFEYIIVKYNINPVTLVMSLDTGDVCFYFFYPFFHDKPVYENK